MKITYRYRLLLLGGSLLAAIAFGSWPAQAQCILQTVNQTGAAATGWAAAIWGTPAAVALSGNCYETPATFAVRTPNNAAPAAFVGASLQIDSGGILYLKHSGGAASANLLMNGGVITFHGGPTSANSPLAGTMQVLADTTINSDQGTPNNRDVWLQSAISGSGNLTVAMNIQSNFVIVSGNNSAYSGNWTCSGGSIQIVSGAINPLGSGTLNLLNLTNSLIFNATNAVVIANEIDGSGPVVKLNTNTVTLSGPNTFSGVLQINSGVLKVGNAAAISSPPTIILAGATLDASPIGGLDLNAGTAQSMNCNGTVISGLTASTGNTLNFNLTPTTNDILNVTGSLTLNGNPTLNLTLSGYKPPGVYRLINYSGTIQGGGSFDLVPPVGSTETFSLDTTTAGQVNLKVVGQVYNLTWVGDGAANSWDTTSTLWAGGTNVYSDGDTVTFNDSGSAIPDITIPATVIPAAMTLNNDTNRYMFDGAGIACAGSLTKLGSNEVDFANAGNNFTGPVTIQAGTLSVGSGSSLGSLGNPTAITNNGVLQVNMAGSGITLNSPISGSGSVFITGAVAVQFGGTNSYTGLTTIGDGCQLNISKSSGLGTTDAGTVVLPNGRVGVNSFVGSLTIPEPLTVSGSGVAAAPGAIYVNSPSNNVTWSGPVTIAADARFRVVNPNTRMNFSNTALGNNVNLECTVGSGDTSSVMSFLNTLSLGSGGSLTVDNVGQVVLAGNTNTWGSTTLNGGTLLVNTVLDGGSVTVNNTAALGGSGVVLGPVSVQDGGTLAPGNAGIGTLILSNSLTLSGTAVTLMEINRTNASTADLLVAPALPFNGTLTVVNTGPALQVGDSFKLFAGAISGSFTVTNLPTFTAPNYVWDTALLQSQGIIRVTTNSLPLLPLAITDIHLNPTSVLLTWNSYPGQLYSVEYSTNLLTWSVAESGIPANAVTNSTFHSLSTIQPAIGSNVTVVQYLMGTVDAQIQDPAALVAAGSLTQGPGLAGATWITSAALGYPSDPVLQVSSASVDFATAQANQAWFTFDLTVGTNVTNLDLASLSFNAARGGASAPRGYGVLVTTPTSTDELVRGATDLTSTRPTWTSQAISLAGFASLQHLTNGQVVTLQIAVYTPATGSSVEFDDLTVKGNISPGPLPPYAGGDKLFLRIKQQ